MRLPQANVSPVHPEDHPRVVEVWETSVRATHDFLSAANVESLKLLVRDELVRLPVLTGVRDTNGRVVGFVGVAGDKIEALFVHPGWRGRRIGQQLLRHAVESHGARSVDVNEQNGQAVGFYLRIGFEIEGRSELDGAGRPFPLLHLRLRDPLSAEEARDDLIPELSLPTT